MSRSKRLFIILVLFLAAVSCKNSIHFSKSRYLERCQISIEDMLLSKQEEEALLPLVFDMEKSPNLHYRNELVYDGNLSSCKALLREFSFRRNHGINDSVLFAHYYALGVSLAESPADIIDLTLCYAAGQLSSIKKRIGEASFPIAKFINDTLAFRSISLVTSGINGLDYALISHRYLGQDRNAISDTKAEELLLWSELGLKYAPRRFIANTIRHDDLLEYAAYTSWKLNKPRHVSYSDSLINHFLKNRSDQSIFAVYYDFYGPIYSRYLQLLKEQEFHRAEIILDFFSPSVDNTDSTYFPLKQYLPERERTDYYDPTLSDGTVLSTPIHRNVLWLLAQSERMGGISPISLCFFEKARFSYLKREKDYSCWLNRAFYEGCDYTFPSSAMVSITEYLRPGYHHNPFFMNLLTLQYNNVDPRCVFDALLYIKGASETIPSSIYSSIKKAVPDEFRAYVDSVRFYDSKRKSPDTEEFLENIYGPTVKDVLNRNIVSYSDVQEKLRDDTAAIEFYAVPSLKLDNEYTYRAAILTKSCSVPIIVELCSSKEMKDLLSRGTFYDNQDAYNTIWEPLESVIDGTNTIFFSTDRLLNICNFQALLMPDKRRLSQKYNLIQLSSTKEVLSEIDSEKYESIALFGGIDYNHGPKEPKGIPERKEPKSNNSVLRSIKRSDFSPLPFTKIEIDSISKQAAKIGASIQYYSSNDGSEEAFKNLSGQSLSILHIATHGFYYTEKQSKEIDYLNSTSTPENPLERCGLLLAGSQNSWRNPNTQLEREDGVLLGEEISRLDFTDVDLVVISACKSAYGDIGSEGVTGLRQAFKRAGAKSILMTLGDVDDEATAFFMNRFYETLFSGENKHTAYNSAIKAMRDSEKYNDSKYWAQFVLID